LRVGSKSNNEKEDNNDQYINHGNNFSILQENEPSDIEFENMNAMDLSSALGFEKGISEKEELSLVLLTSSKKIQNWIKLKIKLRFGGLALLIGGIIGAFFILPALSLLVIGLGLLLYDHFGTPLVNIKKIEKRYWTGLWMPYQNGCMFLNSSNGMKEVPFSLQKITNMNQLKESMERATMPYKEFPVVFDHKNFEEDFANDLETIISRLSDREERTVSIPVIKTNHPVIDSIKKFQAYFKQKGLKNIKTTSTQKELERKVRELRVIETSAFKNNLNEVFNEFESKAAEKIKRMTKKQKESIEFLNEHIEKIGEILSISHFFFYCPTCADQEVSSVLKYDTQKDSDKWYCSACENYFEYEDLIIPIHRMKNNLFNHVWDQLWIEKEDEKLKIYNNIRDQKLELREKEFNHLQETIRNSWNRIKDIRSEIRDMGYSADAQQDAIEKIGTMMVKYERLNQLRKEEFIRDVRIITDQIGRETQRIIKESRNYDQKQLDKAEAQVKKREKIRKVEEIKRHQEKIVMLRAIDEEQKLNRFEQRRHTAHQIKAKERMDRKILLGETGQKVSLFDFMDGFREWKYELFGGPKK
jgi:transcription elongation factor Elf1